ncbi:MAG: carbohydrate kinase [Saprospiraceae bacterium]
MKAICYGEMLWDLLPTGRKAGGAPINCAAHLNNLGISTAMISRVGTDDLGREIVDYFKGKNVNTDLVQMDTTQPTGVVAVDLSDPTDVQYDIVAPAAWDFIEVNAANLAAVQQADYLVYGILAARSEQSLQSLQTLLAKANYKVLDVNFRSPYYSQPLFEQLIETADLVKMNDDELSEIASWYTNATSMKAQMTDLYERFDLKQLLVTRGANGAILLDQNGFTEHSGFSVTVVDTIGSGDSFLAGFISQQMQGKSPLASLTFAAGIGALVATHAGANPPLSLTQINDFINS